MIKHGFCKLKVCSKPFKQDTHIQRNKLFCCVKCSLIFHRNGNKERDYEQFKKHIVKGGKRNCLKCHKLFISEDLKNIHLCRYCRDDNNNQIEAYNHRSNGRSGRIRVD